jgi:hypothetical protein
MTAKRRLVPVTEVKEMLDFLRAEGLQFSGVDVRADGVTFLPAQTVAGNGYDRFKAQEAAGRDRSAHRPKAN